MLLVGGCVSKQEHDPSGRGTGRFKVSSLRGEGEFVTIDTKAGGTESQVDVSGFRVGVLDQDGAPILGQDGQTPMFQWDAFAEIDGQTVTIPSGKYKFTANNRPKVPTPAAWDAPVYEGTTDFSVKIGAHRGEARLQTRQYQGDPGFYGELPEHGSGCDGGGLYRLHRSGDGH